MEAGEAEEYPNEGNEDSDIPDVGINNDSDIAPKSFDDITSMEEVHEDMQVKLQIGNKNTGFKGFERANAFPTSRGDVAMDPITLKYDAIASSSKVIVRGRVKKPKERNIPVLRPILPRKSKDKAKEMLKIIARGIIIPQGMIGPRGRAFQKRIPKRTKRGGNMNLKRRLAKGGKSSKNLLQTVWARDKDRRTTWSEDSFSSDYECSKGCCSCRQFY